MRTTREETVTETRRRRTTTCDFCGADLSAGQQRFERNEASIECWTGNVWPEGDSRERLNYDCCAGCFKSKIMPAIEAATGVKPTQLDPETGEVY